MNQDVECLVEDQEGRINVHGFCDDDVIVGFHAAPVSRFFSIAQHGLYESDNATGGRHGVEGPGVFSAPSIYRTQHYIYEAGERVVGFDEYHVVVFKLKCKPGCTKKRKRDGKEAGRRKKVITQHVTKHKPDDKGIWIDEVYYVSYVKEICPEKR